MNNKSRLVGFSVAYVAVPEMPDVVKFIYMDNKQILINVSHRPDANVIKLIPAQRRRRFGGR